MEFWRLPLVSGMRVDGYELDPSILAVDPQASSRGHIKAWPYEVLEEVELQLDGVLESTYTEADIEEAWRTVGIPLGIFPAEPIHEEPPDWIEMPDNFFLEFLGYEGMDVDNFAFSLAEATTREERYQRRQARSPSPPQRDRSPSTASESDYRVGASDQGLRDF